MDNIFPRSTNGVFIADLGLGWDFGLRLDNYKRHFFLFVYFKALFRLKNEDMVAVCDKRIFTLQVDKDLSLSSSANTELLFFKGPPA